MPILLVILIVLAVTKGLYAPLVFLAGLLAANHWAETYWLRKK